LLNSRKAVTPVIATIILIAATIVLALVVGSYTYGLFGANVKQMNFPSIYLYAGSAASASTIIACNGASMAMTVTNPGTNTSLSSLSISGASGLIQESTYLITGATSCTAQAVSSWTVSGGSTGTIIAVYFGTTGLASGATYNYVVGFANGQSISGELIAQ
jgi:flagellin-like protein